MTGQAVAPRTVLIVDDEEGIREVLKLDFELNGFKVLLASGGEAAYQTVLHTPIDAVLSDIQMDDGDGIELLIKIKALKRRKPAVFLMTGYSDYSVKASLALGALAVFNKPFDSHQLRTSIHASLDALENTKQRLPRFAIDTEVRIEFKETGVHLSGRTINIGKGGIFIALETPLAQMPTVSDVLDFEFQLGTQEIFSGTGKVRWIRKEACGDFPPGLGVEFVSLNTSSQVHLGPLLDRLAPVQS